MERTRIFCISYRYKPFNGVGVLRINYWLERLRETGRDVTLITAEPGEHEDDVIRLPRDKGYPLSSVFIHDHSYYWVDMVCSYLINVLHITQNDSVLLTGGPFLYFLIAVKLRRKFPQLNIILDYRDPFALNPRFNDGFLKKFIKKYFERKFNKAANCCITVNEYCENLLIAPLQSVIIPNGYDERFFSSINSCQKKRNILAYSGKFYPDFTIDFLMDALDNHPELQFHYCSDHSVEDSEHKHYYHGFLTYQQTARLLAEASVGVVITGGKPFESPTKIYDYFAAKLKILIITQGELKSGDIYEITKDNPNVVWVKNETDQISEALTLISDMTYQEWDYSEFARNIGFNKLQLVVNKENVAEQAL